MKPNEIKSNLRAAGQCQAIIAKKCQVSRSAVHQVVHNKRKSKKIRAAIALALKKEILDIWPDQRK